MKQKTIKLKAAEKKEADRLNRNIAITRYGVETANNLHFEAGERLWEYLLQQYPILKVRKARYDRGVIKYTPEDKDG